MKETGAVPTSAFRVMELRDGRARRVYLELNNNVEDAPAINGGQIKELLGLETADRANRFMEILQNQDRFGMIAVSLGYFDTLLSCSASSTSSELSEADQRKAGISPGLVRVAIGYTGTLEQRWDQFTDALMELKREYPMVVA